jgi:NADH-quinone oxidoreductase subunit G
MSYSMEGSPRHPPASLIARFWSPQWNSVQAINKFQIEIGGPLHGGDPGRRLIEPAPGSGAPYSTGIPSRFEPRPDQCLLVPAFHIYGSDECSARSEPVTERIPSTYAGISAGDAKRLGIAEGQLLAVTVGSEVRHLPAQVRKALPAGIVALPVGLPGFPTPGLPAWGRVEPLKAGTAGQEARP